MKKQELIRRCTEKYRPQLSPCKFCGGTDIAFDRILLCGKYNWAIICANYRCGDCYFDRSIEKAVKQWNGEDESEIEKIHQNALNSLDYEDYRG